MAKAQSTAKYTFKTVSSADLQGVLKRTKTNKLTEDDKLVVVEILTHAIKLRKLVEKASSGSGGRTVLASLPFGLDVVK